MHFMQASNKATEAALLARLALETGGTSVFRLLAEAADEMLPSLTHTRCLTHVTCLT